MSKNKSLHGATILRNYRTEIEVRVQVSEPFYAAPADAAPMVVSVCTHQGQGGDAAVRLAVGDMNVHITIAEAIAVRDALDSAIRMATTRRPGLTSNDRKDNTHDDNSATR